MSIQLWLGKEEKSHEGPSDHSNECLWVLQSQTIPHFEFLTHSAVKGWKPMYLLFLTFEHFEREWRSYFSPHYPPPPKVGLHEST